MGKVVRFPHKKITKENYDQEEVIELVNEAKKLLGLYANHLNEYKESRSKRRSYLQDLDEFEELIHGRHTKLVD